MAIPWSTSNTDWHTPHSEEEALTDGQGSAELESEFKARTQGLRVAGGFLRAGLGVTANDKKSLIRGSGLVSTRHFSGGLKNERMGKTREILEHRITETEIRIGGAAKIQ